MANATGSVKTIDAPAAIDSIDRPARELSRRELIEREDAAADRLSVQLGRFPPVAPAGQTNAAQAARFARVAVEEARADGQVSAADALDSAARLLRRLAASEGLAEVLPP